jgi:hypothetical protein
MREHHAYRVPISLMYDAPVDSGRRPSELAPVDLDAAPTGDDVISQILASRPPVGAFGRYWSDQVLRGAEAAAKIDSERFCSVRFEDLIAQPQAVLDRVAGFFALPAGGGWTARAAALVRGAPPARFGTLSGAEQQALAQACRPGMQRLGRA